MDVDLTCEELYYEQEIKHAKNDEVLLNDVRVLQNLLKLEMRYIFNQHYFDCVQKDIKPYMRKVVATWMLEVCEEQRREDHVFPLSMNFLDRFLSVVPISRTQLQLLGAACMLIASKVKETLPLSAHKLVIYTDHSITLNELLEMELLILNYLKWDVLAVTPVDFIEQILHRLQLDADKISTARKHAITFIHLCCTDHKFAMFTPSMIAAGSVGAAVIGLPCQWSSRHRLVTKLHEITSVDVELLGSCLEQVEDTLRANLLHVTTASRGNDVTNTSDTEDKFVDSHQAGDDDARGVGNTPTDVTAVMF